MWDLSSLTRDRTHPFHWKHGILTESMGLPGKPLIPCIFKYQPVCDGEEHLFRAFLDELSSSNGKEFACNVGDLRSISGLGRSPGGGHGNPLQYSCLENSMDKGAWRATVHGAAKSQTRQSNFHSLSVCDGEQHVLRAFLCEQESPGFICKMI